MMNLDTTASAKPQELSKPSDVETPPQVSSPANARIIITGNSVPVDIRAGGRVNKQEKHRARDRAWVETFLPNARAAHLPGEKGHWVPQRRSVRYRVRPERGHA